MGTQNPETLGMASANKGASTGGASSARAAADNAPEAVAGAADAQPSTWVEDVGKGKEWDLVLHIIDLLPLTIPHIKQLVVLRILALLRRGAARRGGLHLQLRSQCPR